MLLWLLALIRNYFRRGRRRCCAARQPPGLFAFIEPIFLLSHPVHSPTVFASYSNRDEAHISELRGRNRINQALRLAVLDPRFCISVIFPGIYTDIGT